MTDAFRAVTLMLSAAAIVYLLFVVGAVWSTIQRSGKLTLAALLVGAVGLALGTVFRVGKPFTWWQTPFNFVFATLLVLATRAAIREFQLAREPLPPGTKEKRSVAPTRMEQLTTRVTWVMMAVLAAYTLYSYQHLTNRQNGQGRQVCQTQVVVDRGLRQLAPVTDSLGAVLVDSIKQAAAQHRLPGKNNKGVKDANKLLAHIRSFHHLVNELPTPHKC